LEELKTAIGPHLLRKTKEECLDLPPLIRKSIKIDISDELNEEYERIIDTMKTKIKLTHTKQNNGEVSLLYMCILIWIHICIYIYIYTYIYVYTYIHFIENTQIFMYAHVFVGK
jgi:SNF2 family DNA or RNA helicase